MITSYNDLRAVLAEVYGDVLEWPKPFNMLEAVARVAEGVDLAVSAKACGVAAFRLRAAVAQPDATPEVIGRTLDAAIDERVLKRARAGLGQLLLGTLAERAFERIYKEHMGTNELQLEDDRANRSDTDYRVRNGMGRPVFRMNIKFHGARFRAAMDMVGLEPDDCFALATYKIWQATEKQKTEVLPYLFVIVGVPHLSGEVAAEAFPERFVDLAALVAASKVPKKRNVEDRLVKHLLDDDQDPDTRATIAGFAERVRRAEWNVISAGKADKLLREKLFERVYAVRVRGFAQHYRNAELDMHFSVSQDLMTLTDFLDLIRARGLPSIHMHIGDRRV